MLRYIAKLQTKLSQDRGATAVEYGLLVALIAGLIVGTVGLLGGQINTSFNTVLTRLQQP